MITLYQQQIQVYEELSKLEQRILCKFLPKSFDHVTIDDLNLTEKDGYMELPLKEKQKKLQQLKRTMLDHLIQAYENKIVDYEYRYQQELIQLEKNISHNNRSDGISLVDSIKKYLTHRKNQFKRENLSKMAFFRTTLFRRRRRYYSSTRKKNIIGVWPQAIVDVSSLPLNNAEWSYICSAGEWLIASTGYRFR
jgi:Fe2+ transport system protein B